MRKLSFGCIALYLLVGVPFGSFLRAQQASISPKLIPFPNQAIGGTSSPILITLTNGMSATLKISAIQTSLPFSQTNNCGSSLAPAKSCTISVTFSPTAAKYYTATLTVTDSSPGSPHTSTLTGNGIVPVTYTPKVGGYYFYNQIVSTPSTPQPVTITNNQTVPLTFRSISSSADFPFTTNCGNGAGAGTLAAGATCAVQVTFNPRAVGKSTANLTIAESALGSPIVIPLQGTGISGTPGPGVNVTPPAPCGLASETTQFSATVTGETNTAVTWAVDNITGGNATVGTITANGLYTAPPFSGSHRIKAISKASAAVSGAAVITVSTTPVFEIYPYVASIPTSGHQTFQPQICLVPDTAPVTYTVDNIPGGNGTVGTVSSAGVYTAPAVPGKHTVRVTDPALNRTSGGVVTVFSTITVDFGSRTNTSHPIPADMFGTARGEGIHNAADRTLLTDAGLTVSRLDAEIPLVFATTTPDWTKIDPLITSIKASGEHAMLQLEHSPAWLQPTTGPCKGGNQFAAPTNVNQWAQIAAAYVAHMDSAFPGIVQDYEIWNEPNATGLCSSDNLTNYMKLYAAAAAAMKAQAASDGTKIRVGGPALSGYSALWISTFLANSSTAPNVDFVSYHQYLFGLPALGVKWDKFTGNPSLYEETQDPSVGAFANYNKTRTLLAAGKQPGGAQTPVYVTEFNTNWAFFKDCCRNDPTYAPVWNALYVTDMLDSVYNGSLKVPDKLIYFAGSAYPYFCAIGVLNTNMDCLYSAGATPVPYPQYYVFDLIASKQYLGLSGGGYMAKSISTPTGGGGLATTAFYTSTQDAIVITNPTSTAYTQISVTFANPGFTHTQGTLYQIVKGAAINSSTISFAKQGTSLVTTVDIPSYSVQAIALK